MLHERTTYRKIGFEIAQIKLLFTKTYIRTLGTVLARFKMRAEDNRRASFITNYGNSICHYNCGYVNEVGFSTKPRNLLSHAYEILVFIGSFGFCSIHTSFVYGRKDVPKPFFWIYLSRFVGINRVDYTILVRIVYNLCWT